MDPDIGERIRRLEKALLLMDRKGVKGVLMPDDRTFSIREIETSLVPALESIGKGWEEGRIALSHVYMSGRICEELMDTILPAHAPGRIATPTMAIAVLEDHHMLGQRIVYSVLRSSGFELLSYGQKELNELVDYVRADGVKILLISTLMLRSALRVKELRARLTDAGLNIRLVVGGAPFRMDKQLWQEVGADATSDTAIGAVAAVKRLMAEVSQ